MTHAAPRAHAAALGCISPGRIHPRKSPPELSRAGAGLHAGPRLDYAGQSISPASQQKQSGGVLSASQKPLS